MLTKLAKEKKEELQRTFHAAAHMWKNLQPNLYYISTSKHANLSKPHLKFSSTSIYFFFHLPPHIMDRRLSEAIKKNDITTLHKLFAEDKSIIKQRVPGSFNTILHLAARLGYVELASEIMTLCPDMVSAENKELESPLHEACKEGQIVIAKQMLEKDPWVIYKVNCRDESVLFVACERGRLDVVKYLLDFPMLLKLEADMLTSSLHVAASSGHTDVVKELLQARPDFAQKKDSDGCIPMHLACSKGHLDITREFLRLDADLAVFKDNEGRTPLHFAAIKGRINVIDEILSVSLGSVEVTTNKGETILHLAVKNNQFDVVKYLMERIDTSQILNLQDNDGNNILHLATAAKLGQMVTYLLKFNINVNAMNFKGYTPLDVIEADGSNSGLLIIVPALVNAGAKRCDEMSPGIRDIHQVAKFSSEISGDRILNMPSPTWRKRSSQSASPRHHRHNHRRSREIKLQNEGLRNARKTIAIVAVLIATVTFTAGINPPGGFNQTTGKAIRGQKTAFKVFLVCNIVALFLSLGIVNVLVSIIPFRRNAMMKLMVATHKVMWVSTLFMASGFIAAVWTILPQDKGTRWMTIELVVVGGGCTMLVFLALGLMLAKHWCQKHEWRQKRKEKKVKDGSPHSSVSHVDEMKKIRKKSQDYSSNSDLESSDNGYHLY